MSEPAPEQALWDFLRGAMMTKALGIVADLGIPEALSAGPRPVAALARDTGVDADALYRILRALASDGVFAEEETGVFRATELSELLLRPGWKAFAHLFADVFYEAVADLDRAVRTGSATFPARYGEEFWPWLGARADERATFDAAMAEGKETSATRLAGVDWGDGDTIVDVGGGNGSLLIGALRDRPNVRGIVFDVPETDRDEDAFPANVQFVPGSFFDRVPTGDAYVLSRILHDWDDDRAAAILSSIRTAARPGARLFVVETVLDTGNEANSAKWLDLLMLVLAGGRERTEREWSRLLESAGFEPVAIQDALIEARCR